MQIKLSRSLQGLLLIIMMFIICPAHVRADSSLHFICVNRNNHGQDAILLESEGEFAFIDCGQWKDREQIRSAMESVGVTHDNLRFIIGTHAHGDHIGFLNDLMKEYTCIERIYLMPFTADCMTDPGAWTDESWQNAMTTADRLGVPVVDTFMEGAPEQPWLTPDPSNRYTASPHFMFGNAQIDIYNYDQSYLTQKVENANDTSLVVKITAEGHTALITGDLSNAESPGDEETIAAEVGHVDILKIPHHGYRWYDTNEPADLATFSPAWMIQTGYTWFFDYEYDDDASWQEILELCRNGTRYAATGWYNERIMQDGNSRKTITIDMGDLSSNLDEDIMIAATDKYGDVYKFRAGMLCDDPLLGSTAYLSTGIDYQQDLQIIHLGKKEFAVNGSGQILSNTVEIGDTEYMCDPDKGTCTIPELTKDLPEKSPVSELVDGNTDVEWDGSYFATWDKQVLLDAVNEYRAANGKEELQFAKDHTYADLRAIACSKNKAEPCTDEIIVTEFGQLDTEGLMQHIQSDENCRELLLSDSTYLAMSCLISPRDIGFATIYTLEFYDANMVNRGESPAEESGSDPTAPDTKQEPEIGTEIAAPIDDNSADDLIDKTAKELLIEILDKLDRIIRLLEEQ